MSDISTGPHHRPGRYPGGPPGFDGLSMPNENEGTTIIGGPIADQAALHGSLQKVRDLGLPLVSVIQVEPDRPECPPARPDNSRIHRRRPIWPPPSEPQQ